MKWNILIASLVLGMGMSSQSFGFDLLDRMLGVNGSGCNSCCEIPEPTCCAPEPTCCAPEPVCCDPEPTCAVVDHGCGSCGHESSCGHKSCCGFSLGKGPRLLENLFGGHHKSSCGHHGDSCCEAEPTCVVEEPSCCVADAGCGSCGHSHKSCGHHRTSLLDRIFSCHKCKSNHGCGSCGSDGGCASCGGHGHSHSDGGDAAPLPPAPVADPSAFVPTQRRVVHARASLIR